MRGHLTTRHELRDSVLFLDAGTTPHIGLFMYGILRATFD